MKWLGTIALATALHIPAALGCSIENLKGLAGDHLDRLPSSTDHTIEEPRWSTEGATWQMFEKENATPHSIVVTLWGEMGQTKIRISFANRRDFVISTTDIHYAEHIVDPDRTGKFKVQPTEHYFFCDSKPQIVADASNAAEVSERANNLRALIFEEAKALQPELQRVPE